MRDCFRRDGEVSSGVPTVGTMLSTTQEIPTETLEHSAEIIGQVSESVLDFPYIVLTDAPVKSISQLACWSRAIVSIGISLIGHAGVLAWLGYASGVLLTRVIPVQEGHASIELTAAYASTSQQADHDDESDVVEIETSDPPPPRLNERVPTFAAVSIPIQRADDSDLPPALRATSPNVELPCPSEPHLHQSRHERETFPPEEASSTSDEDEPVARTRVKRMPTVKVLAEPIEKNASSDSLASPASQAADGADSVPSIVYNPSPLYPSDALKSRRMGRVVLRVSIAPDGSVTETTIYRSSGVDSLDQAASVAVRKWRFESSESTSGPVRYAAVPVRFEIVETDAQD